MDPEDTMVGVEETVEQHQEETLCGFCKEQVNEGRSIPLECGHICHAVCILIDVAAQHQNDSVSRCPECNEYIVTPEMQTAMFNRANDLLRIHDVDVEEETLDALIESSVDFKKDFSILRDVKKPILKLKGDLMKKINEIHTAFINQVRDTVTILKGTHKQTVNSVFASEEFKTYKKQLGKFQSKVRAMSRKYTIAQFRIENRFRGGVRFRGRRRFRFRNSLTVENMRWYIKRKFRIRMY
jgi:hypothetical protein